jgi:hypothetical protein
MYIESEREREAGRETERGKERERAREGERDRDTGYEMTVSKGYYCFSSDDVDLTF